MKNGSYTCIRILHVLFLFVDDVKLTFFVDKFSLLFCCQFCLSLVVSGSCTCTSGYVHVGKQFVLCARFSSIVVSALVLLLPSHIGVCFCFCFCFCLDFDECIEGISFCALTVCVAE